ncbi:MAG: UvrD-helicase domain-containing protein [Chitinophagales bacterium]|nr:UvrD-helicase domain-containing protein [Chitinophagales bacterium]
MLNIYKSSAGSGKTYTLVREYLRLAFISVDKYRHILAITFTNKAAAEMKNRILEALDGIAGSNEAYETLTRELATLCGKSEAEMKQTASDILRHMLHNYSDISVCTIDSFVHRVVRSFAYDLHLSMNFEIEMDSKKLLSDAVNLLLDRLNESDTQITQAVIDFAEDNMEDGRSWNIDNALVKLGKQLFTDDARPFLQELNSLSLDSLRESRGALINEKMRFESTAMAEGKAAYQAILTAGLTVDDFHQKGKGIYSYFKKYADGKVDEKDGNKNVHATIFDDKWGKNVTDETLKATLKEHYKRIADLWEKNGKDYSLCKLLLKNFYSFILLADLQKLMEEIKKGSNVLHISDFQHKVFEIVKEQDAPVIYERIGDWYDNILIDEFQDTSVMQWRNLLPLVENSQFKSEDSLIVGDAKQAIYRFRGGEVAQFVALPAVHGSDTNDLLKQREVAIQNYGTRTHVLDKNYRSRKEVIDFNNDFYKVLATLPELGDKVIYQDAAQLPGKDKNDGFVQIEFLEDDKDADISLLNLRNARVLQIVEDALKRGYGYKDIAVLTRTNKNASAIATHLIQHQIKVVSPESLLITQSPKVALLLSVFRYLDKSDSSTTRAEMIHFVFKLSGKLMPDSAFNFPTDVSDFELYFSQLVGINFQARKLQTGKLSDLSDQLIAMFELESDDPFLQFFCDEILLFSSRYGNRISEFLNWWDRVKDKKSIIYPDSMDAVRIMTIHKSKGLQFPVVILADACEIIKAAKDFFWVPLGKKFIPQLHIGLLPVSSSVKDTEFDFMQELETEHSFLDMLNLLYVGTTRAEDALFILSKTLSKEPTENKTVTSLLISYLKDKKIWKGFESYFFGNPDFSKSVKSESVLSDSKIYKKGEVVKSGKLMSSIQIKMKADLFWSNKTNVSIQEGNLLHETLKLVKHQGDEERAVEKAAQLALLSTADKESLLSKVKQIIYHNDCNVYFTADKIVINERKLLKCGEHIRIPDRLVMADGCATIIDYKTGSEMQKHKDQLNAYAALLNEAGIPVVEKVLIYTETMKKEVVA